MSDPKSENSIQHSPAQTSTNSKSTTETEPTSSATGKDSVSKLTPEEQMALFEKELKENDWGHQPC